MISRLIAVEPLDSFFFPDHRPFNQDDPGLSEAATRFPPPPHVMAGAVRFAIARRLGWDEGWDEGMEARRQPRHAGQTGQEALDQRPGDWCDFPQADGIDLRKELGSGPLASGNLLFGPPLLISGTDLEPEKEILYPVPRTLAGRFDRKGELVELALVRPGEPVVSDIGLEALPDVDTADAQRFEPLTGWWLPKGALEKLLSGKVPQAESLRPPSKLMRTGARVGLQTDYANHRTQQGKLYAAAHGAFRAGKRRLRFACRLAIADGKLTEDHLPAGTLIPFGSHGRGAEVSACMDRAPPRPEGKTPLQYWVSLLSPAWLKGEQPVPDEISNLPGRVVSAVHERPLMLGAWDRSAPSARAYHRLHPTGSTWFLKASKNDERKVRDCIKKLAAAGQGLGRNTEVGFGAAVIGAW